MFVEVFQKHEYLIVKFFEMYLLIKLVIHNGYTRAYPLDGMEQWLEALLNRTTIIRMTFPKFTRHGNERVVVIVGL